VSRMAENALVAAIRRRARLPANPVIHRRCLRWGTGLGGLAAALSVTLVIRPVPLLVWNASASAPIGLYAVDPWATVAVGDQVIARLPLRWRTFADVRRYLPEAVPAVKRVAATDGDRVCARGRTVFVNGRAIALRLPRDGAGRPMPAWTGCFVLDPGHVFLLMPARGSFDGRYFGMTRRADILGRAIPLWTR
jgi:conjugative transfer signal peptidase TraF